MQGQRVLTLLPHVAVAVQEAPRRALPHVPLQRGPAAAWRPWPQAPPPLANDSSKRSMLHQVLAQARAEL